jgi:hypothetical protein
MTPVTLTLFRKSGGPLTKRISLDAANRIVSDGSACLMAAGSAERVLINNIADMAELIGTLQADQALGLGALRPDLPDRVDVTTKRKLTQINGTLRPDLIARTGEAIRYRPNQPAYVLFDHDTKGMPPDVAARVSACGGFGGHSSPCCRLYPGPHACGAPPRPPGSTAPIPATNCRAQAACTSTSRYRTAAISGAS